MTFVVQVKRSSTHISKAFRFFYKKNTYNSFTPDLWSLSKQLLLLQSQPFLLDLLQPHLIVASHDSAVAGRQRPSLLHWGTLGDPLRVQGCKRDG